MPRSNSRRGLSAENIARPEPLARLASSRQEPQQLARLAEEHKPTARRARWVWREARRRPWIPEIPRPRIRHSSRPLAKS